jgi:YbbR domain-containing protein
MLTRPFRHLGLKVLSLLLAVALWFMVAGQKEAERSLRVPLEFQNIPERLELTEEPPSFVDVRLRGPAGSLSQIRAGDVVAVLDLSSARAGRRLFHLTAEQVSAPVGLRVVHVLPATLGLTFEASATKTVPIVPVIEGEPARGYEVGRVAASPAMAQVGGPATALQRVTEATTEPLLIEGQRTRISERVNVAVADDSVRVRAGQTTLVTVEIRPAPLERSVDDVAVQVRNLGNRRRAEVTPDRVSVTVKGLASTVEALDAKSVPVFVDLTGLDRGSYNLPVRLDPTSRFGVTRVTPDRVRVRIR